MGFRILLDGVAHEIEIVRRKPHLVVRIDGHEHEVTITGTPADGRQTIEIAGAAVHFSRAHVGECQIVKISNRTFETSIIDPRSAAAQDGGGLDVIRAPMPGSVISLHRMEGEWVSRGETIVTIESMKLQTALNAPRDGKISQLLRQEGETFEKDEVIVRLDTAAGEA